jgi:hypothetical protein
VWTPKGYDWVYQRFISEPKPGYDVVQARPFENRFLLEQIPDFYERLKGSYDERFYQQEALGQYLHMRGGLVYHAFDRGAHVAELEVDSSLPLLWALDFNVDPMSSVVAQISGGRTRVLQEIVLRHATTEEACRQFHEAFGTHAAGIVVYGDASGYSAQTTGSSDSRAASLRASLSSSLRISSATFSFGVASFAISFSSSFTASSGLEIYASHISHTVASNSARYTVGAGHGGRVLP